MKAVECTYIHRVVVCERHRFAGLVAEHVQTIACQLDAYLAELESLRACGIEEAIVRAPPSACDLPEHAMGVCWAGYDDRLQARSYMAVRALGDAHLAAWEDNNSRGAIVDCVERAGMRLKVAVTR